MTRGGVPTKATEHSEIAEVQTAGKHGYKNTLKSLGELQVTDLGLEPSQVRILVEEKSMEQRDRMEGRL